MKKSTATFPLLCFVAALLVLVTVPASATAQRRILTEQERMDRDLAEREFSLRTLGKFKKKDLEVGPRPINLQQVKKDFEGMQIANNSILSAIANKQPLDSDQIKADVSRIRSKASSLKAQLSLPKPQEEKHSNGLPLDQPLKTALLQLDVFITRFVNNPVFKSKPIVVDANHSVQASRDLDEIIDLSGRIRRSAELARMQKPVSVP